MKKTKSIITLSDWEAEAFKAGVKNQISISTLGSYKRNLDNYPVFLWAKKGDILYCTDHHVNLEVTADPIIRLIGEFTDQDALNEGIGSIYPHSNVGDDFFYLPDQIIAASALDCFKHYWDCQEANINHPFEKNPYVLTIGLKYRKKI